MNTNTVCDFRQAASQPFLALEEILDIASDDLFGNEPNRGWVLIDQWLAPAAAAA